MTISARAVAWLLGLLTLALLAVAALAMTGALADTVFSTYSGFHVLGVLIAAVGVLALVAALLRGRVRI